MPLTEIAIRATRRRMPDFYTAAALKAELAIHSTGTLAGVAAVIVLLDITIRNHGNPNLTAIPVYALGLLAMLGFSATYNLTRPTDWRINSRVSFDSGP